MEAGRGSDRLLAAWRSRGLTDDGDDTPAGGNDIRFWLVWHQRHGSGPHPPRIVIEGAPVPEQVRLDLDFGWPDSADAPVPVEHLASLR